MSYSACKDGLREAFLYQSEPDLTTYDPKYCGWFHSRGKNPQQLLDPKGKPKSYKTLGDYIADKIGKEGYDFIQTANCDQGGDSYNILSWRRKLCVLNNSGFDCTDVKKYPDADSFFNAMDAAGYYNGSGRQRQRLNFEYAFNEARKDPAAFHSHSEAVLKHNALLQVFLENMWITGTDHASGTVVLVRTETGSVVMEDYPGHKGIPADKELTYHKPGVCESHSNIQAVTVFGDCCTAIRVPYSRIHGLWFLQRKTRTRQAYYGGDWNYPDVVTGVNSAIQYLAPSENEISADTHGLPIVYSSFMDRGDRPGTRDKAVKALLDWEQRNPQETVKEKLK